MSGEKTEQPTPQRLRRLRREGNIAMSREVGKAASALGALVGSYWLSLRVPSWFRALMTQASVDDTPGLPLATLDFFSHTLLFGILGVTGIAACCALIAGLAQSEMLFSLARLKPDMKRFKPGEIWRSRLRKEVWFQGAFSLCFAILATWLGWRSIRALILNTPEFTVRAALSERPFILLQPIARELLIVLLTWVALSAFAAVIDLVWQRRSFLERNKMSRKEIEDEHKSNEGDPNHKAKRKQLHREILSGSAARAIAEASVVVRNPIHLAVVLRYDPAEIDAPVVGISARGDAARQLLKLARFHGVPEVTDPPTARALIQVPTGEPIPETLFEPVAVIFRYLHSQQEHLHDNAS